MNLRRYAYQANIYLTMRSCWKLLLLKRSCAGVKCGSPGKMSPLVFFGFTGGSPCAFHVFPATTGPSHDFRHSAGAAFCALQSGGRLWMLLWRRRRHRSRVVPHKD